MLLWPVSSSVKRDSSDDSPPDEASLDDALTAALATLPPAKAAKEVAKALKLDRHAVYARAMELKGAPSEA